MEVSAIDRTTRMVLASDLDCTAALVIEFSPPRALSMRMIMVL